MAGLEKFLLNQLNRSGIENTPSKSHADKEASTPHVDAAGGTAAAPLAAFGGGGRNSGMYVLLVVSRMPGPKCRWTYHANR
jgi:hypothetical protein